MATGTYGVRCRRSGDEEVRAPAGGVVGLAPVRTRWMTRLKMPHLRQPGRTGARRHQTFDRSYRICLRNGIITCCIGCQSIGLECSFFYSDCRILLEAVEEKNLLVKYGHWKIRPVLADCFQQYC